ncbi:P-type ATPase [Pseudomassariella vexata]|uniref:Phospholipid-transporting ATPase n=1 Tax=Pseudomassariella vexata TaxID=1141098 RepID=A0A1Y2DLX9_9PEZI|nr:P-type ATPase [Pseudomassariella vexata]ORY60272.1 P-type ATPase [Pseudomassariella vexata]
MGLGKEAYLEEGTEKGTIASSAASRTRKQVHNFRASAHERTSKWYQKYFVEGVLRQKPLKPSKDGRHVPLRIEHVSPLIDERRGHEYISNTIRTSRYTVYDFLPKQLLFQFTRLANFYFLCVGVPQTIPGLSTTGSYTTILPLLFFVLLTIAKEGYDDYKRHRLDKLENANTVTVLGRPLTQRAAAGSAKWLLSRISTSRKPIPAIPDDHDDGDVDQDYKWRRVQWKDVKVGDILRLSRDEEVPADLVLLHATGENGLAYIDTMALDGETNLKSREASPAFKGCSTIAAIRACQAELVLEDPNPDLYRFDGRVTTGDRTVPLTLNEIVYRGTILRNTERAIGIVINTGEECKIRLNANQHPKAKKPALEAVSNKIVITLAAYVIILSVGCSMGYIIWRGSTEKNAFYLSDATVPFKEIIIGFAIQFNNVIPLALYISLEIVKIGQMLMLNGDMEMYDEATDTPARCNTNTILENLGQISYVFSDKTGTLTDNVMKFRKLSIAGTSWLHEMDLESEAEPSPVEQVVSFTPSKVVSRKSREATRVIPESHEPSIASPISITVTSPPLGRSSSHYGRRSSSHWRSTGRPDHPQPELTTTDLLEYLQLRPASPFARKARDYILCLALCHTCLPEVKDDKVDFQASSPDELALVRAAQDLGYLVMHRSSQSVTLKITSENDEKTETYEILDVIEFSSKRKRMSIVVRYPDGRICIICKGADSMILPRLKMANLALKKASEVRQSADMEIEMLRRSEQLEPRNSFGGRPSLTLARRSIGASVPAHLKKRPAIERTQSFEASKVRRSEDNRASRPSLGVRTVSFDIAKTLATPSPMSPSPIDNKFSFIDDPLINDDSAVFTRCFKHLDDFATEGLRTLLFARKFIPAQEYRMWKKIYNEATTSLVNRQEMIEEAGEMIEQSLDLVGASAIEDKLQKGVPETVDRLRRANIKIWMLTGDKRETAINIAHSARICRPASDIFILDSSKGDLETQILAAAEDIQAGCIHSVVVIDGQTLAVVEQSPRLKILFYTLIPTINAVICCRASPAQKSSIVKAIRQRIPTALTLAIGDGANDLAMISAAHVGVGISGKEGLQAARVADYAIAQFRFLQRLLLVHGRWNYVRTAKFIIATFWKEMFFYLPTALYQRYNGYTGTSLYESWSLTVLNTLFTSLCVIVPGVWEQDLSAQTLLAVPELYVHGQRNMGLNIRMYVGWMLTGVLAGFVTWFAVWAGYGGVLGMIDDEGLFAQGDLAFSVCIVWINVKLLIVETHNKTSLVLGSFAITFAGWWAWNAFLAAAYAPAPSPYAVRGGFTTTFGRDPLWWLTLIVIVCILLSVELVCKTVRRNLLVARLWRWPPWKGGSEGVGESVEEWDLELWQELEKDPVVRERLRKIVEEEEEESEDGSGELDRQASEGVGLGLDTAV